MLQALNDKLKGWATGLIIGVISVIFVLWGISYYFEGNASSGPIVAKVGDSEISSYELQTATNNIRQSLAEQGQTEDLNNPKWRQIALNQLITRELLDQGAKKMGISLTTEQLNQAIYQIPYFQENGQFSMDKYNQILKTVGLTTNQVRSMLEKQLLATQVSSGLISSDFVLPNEENQAFMLLNQSRFINYAAIPYSEVKTTTKITDKEIESYYKSHQSEFISPEKVKLSYIELSLDDVAKRIEVTDGQIQAYYNENKAKFTKKDKDNKEVTQPLSKVKSQIEQKLKQQQAQILYSSLGNKMANAAYENTDSLDQAAAIAKVKIQTTPYFSKNEQVSSGIISNEQVKQAAFSEEVLKNKYNSDVINISPKNAVIIRLDKSIAQTEKPLSEVKAQIQNILKEQNEKDVITKQAESALKALNSGKKIQAISGVSLNWKTNQEVKPIALKLPAELTQAVSATEVNKDGQSTYQMTEGDDGIYLYKITKVQSPTKADSDYYQLKMQSNGLVNSMQTGFLYQAYINYLRSIISVKITQTND